MKSLRQYYPFKNNRYYEKWPYKSSKRTTTDKFSVNSLKGILLVDFPEKEKHFFIKNLAAENKIPLITQYASLLLKDSRNMDDLLGVDDPIQALFDKVKAMVPCICFINDLDSIGKQRIENKSTFHLLDKSMQQLSLTIANNNFLSNIIHDKSNQDHLTVLNKTRRWSAPWKYYNEDFTGCNFRKKFNIMRPFLGHREKNFQQWFFTKPYIFSKPKTINALSKNQNDDIKNQTFNQNHRFSNKVTTFNIIDKQIVNNSRLRLDIKNSRHRLDINNRLPYWLYKNPSPMHEKETAQINTPSKKETYKNLNVNKTDTHLEKMVYSKRQPNGYASNYVYRGIMPPTPINVFLQKLINQSTVIDDKINKTTNLKFKTAPNLDTTTNNEDHLKMNETEIIKRTALLKFLQILDGFDSKPLLSKTHFASRQISNLFKNLFNVFSLYYPQATKVTKSIFRGISTASINSLNELYLKSEKKSFQPNFRRPKNLLMAKAKVNISQTSNWSPTNNTSLLWKFFQKPLFSFSKIDKNQSKMFRKQLIINSQFPNYTSELQQPIFVSELIANQKFAEKLNSFNSSSETYPFFFKPAQKLVWSTYVKNFSLHFLQNHVYLKSKTNQIDNFKYKSSEFYYSMLIKQLGKDYFYINKEIRPTHRTLNLLCVWPCYNDDILGSAYLNDSGSYILPEYFQLLNIGPKLKKSKITLIASTNNLTTLDAALLRPGRFDTFINFDKSSFSKPSIDEPHNSVTPYVFLFKRTDWLIMKFLNSGFLEKAKLCQSLDNDHFTRSANNPINNFVNKSPAFKNFIELFIFVIYKSYLTKHYSPEKIFDKQGGWSLIRWINKEIRPTHRTLNDDTLVSFQDSVKQIEKVTNDLQGKSFQTSFWQNFPQEKTHGLHGLGDDQKLDKILSDHVPFNLNNHQNPKQPPTNNIFLKSTRQLLFSIGSIAKEKLYKKKTTAGKSCFRRRNNFIGSVKILLKNKNVETSTSNQKISKLAKYNLIYKKKISRNQKNFFQSHSITSILRTRTSELIKPSKLRFDANTLLKNETNDSLSKYYKMGLLDTTIFLLIFYSLYNNLSINSMRLVSGRNSYNNQILKRKFMDSIKISMPYKSILFSHWLLSLNEVSNFSEPSGESKSIQIPVGRCIEILIFNKFKNFLIDSTEFIE